MGFERVEAEKNAVVEIDDLTRLIRVTVKSEQVSIMFNTPAHFVGKVETPGVRDLALRTAISETEKFFFDRYTVYKAAIENDPKLARLLNSVADSTNPDEVIERTRAAGQYVVSQVPAEYAEQASAAMGNLVDTVGFAAETLRRQSNSRLN